VYFVAYPKDFTLNPWQIPKGDFGFVLGSVALQELAITQQALLRSK